VLVAPHLGATGHDNVAAVERYGTRRVLWAEQGPFGMALAAVDGHQRDAFQRASAGYVGTSDGWQDFAQHGAMTWQYGQAGPGKAATPCSFRIAGGAPGKKVSWEVKAVRNDKWVQSRHAGEPIEIEKQGVDLGRVDGKRRVRFRLGPLPFTGGKYWVTLGVHGRDVSRVYHVQDQRYSFEVQQAGANNVPGDAAVLCYERSHEYCHRRLIAEAVLEARPSVELVAI
jgi:hypothetical protein